MTLKIIFIIAVFLVALPIFAQVPPIEPGVSQTLAKWRAARYSDVRYKLNLTLEKMSPVLKGTIEIRVKVASQAEPPASAGGGTSAQAETRPVGSVPQTPIILDWRKIKGFEDCSTISNVSVNGKALTVDAAPPADAGGSAFEQNEHLIFRDGVVAGENVIKLDFTSPILTSGSAITRYVDKEDGAEYIYSLFVPSDASTAFPVFDQPDLKARFTLSIRTDGTLWNSKVISNEMSDGMSVFGGTFEGQDVKPSVVYKFKETKPISTYVFAFAAGPFVEFDSNQITNSDRLEAGLPAANVSSNTGRASPPLNGDGVISSRIFVRKSQAAKFQPHAAEVFRLNREGIKFLESYFDYKFPFPKYDIVLIPEFPFGGMEHAGATFLRESSVIFPQEPTKNDYISRANVIFHEAAHQWFGDTVTMKWFDDLWLKEGFAEFMAYKTLEKVMPESGAWKVFYERNKQAAYLTDATKGTTAIYQPIANLSAAKSAYGNIVYRKAPSFLKQAEFYIGPDKFQTAVRAFLKKHEFANAGWEDLVKEFENSAAKEFKEKSGVDVKVWAQDWVRQRGLAMVRVKEGDLRRYRRREDIEKTGGGLHDTAQIYWLEQTDVIGENKIWNTNVNVLMRYSEGNSEIENVVIRQTKNYQFATF